MRARICVLLAGFVLALVAASPAHAVRSAGACAVTPNPTPVGTPYTVTAAGLTVSTAFTVRIKQAPHPDLVLIVASDASGNASTGAVSWGATGPQEPGSASVTWRKWQGMVGGGSSGSESYGPVEAACSWTITA